jgi:NADPH:quinone reductase-like Zn-dependent oxidoreductase
VTAAEGACAVVAGYMALQSAWQAGIGGVAGGSEGLNVLIPGASGGVGVVLLQLVKQAGAHATVTCGERNMELLRGLGADEVLDYRTPEGAAYASPSGRKYHVVLNCNPAPKWWTSPHPRGHPGRPTQQTRGRDRQGVVRGGEFLHGGQPRGSGDDDAADAAGQGAGGRGFLLPPAAR